MATAFRIKCPNCGEVLNIYQDGTCSKCSAPVSCTNEGEIQLYRMGNPLGAAVGYGIYINDVPMGHLANKESIRIPLPYGTYKVHFTCGMTRKCEDATVTLSPDTPIAYLKGSIKAGFWSNTLFVNVATKDDMPKD